jgi:hypothetical protein
VALDALAGERWLVGPAGAEPHPALQRFFAERGLAAPEQGAFATEAAAAAAAADGQGVMLAIAHTVLDALRRGTLVRLDVRGTPTDAMWHAATLAADRRSPVADALRRFVTTPEATQAIVARPRRRAGRALPPPVLRDDLERGGRLADERDPPPGRERVGFVAEESGTCTAAIGRRGHA